MIWQKNTQFHSLAIQLNITGYITTTGLAISKKSKTSTTPWRRPTSLIYTGRHECNFSHTYNQLLTLKKEQKHTKHNRNGHNWLLLELHFDGIQNLQWHMQIKWTYMNSHRKYGSAPQLSRKQSLAPKPYLCHLPITELRSMNEDTRNPYSLGVQNTCNKSHPEDVNGHNIEKNFIKKGCSGVRRIWMV